MKVKNLKHVQDTFQCAIFLVRPKKEINTILFFVLAQVVDIVEVPQPSIFARGMILTLGICMRAL